jgi:hypothetical protein
MLDVLSVILYLVEGPPDDNRLTIEGAFGDQVIIDPNDAWKMPVMLLEVLIQRLIKPHRFGLKHL